MEEQFLKWMILPFLCRTRQPPAEDADDERWRRKQNRERMTERSERSFVQCGVQSSQSFRA
ncbi:hypothetical protein AD947_11055 [Acetobacter tropicalis]|uniref:Uncharacterized protein n=1 Tax=Acetobacter tropicalis TaxID=104102 RepID=A0A149TT41_9PROT|nr:hypothetical protein AD947_11055 [Acetobacter tropicalis]